MQALAKYVAQTDDMFPSLTVSVECLLLLWFSRYCLLSSLPPSTQRR